MSRRWTTLSTFLREAFRILGATNGPIVAADAFFIAAPHLGDIQLLEVLRATGTVNPNYLLRATPGSLHGMSALWEAIDFGPEAVVKWLIQRGGVTRFDVIDRQHNNLYHRALRWNHPNRQLTIRYLLDHFDPDELISPNTDKVTPLEMAIGRQPYEMIHLLLSRIPPIGNRLLRREDFSYPLSVCLCTAACRDRLDVLQLLVQWMDVNGILLRPELPPLFTALQHQRHQIPLWLIEQDISLDISVNNVRPISAAAALGFNDIVQILLAKGVPANSDNPEDRSALVAALMVGNLPAAQLLLDAGADTNVHIDGDEQFTEKGKETLLLWAAARNHPETVRFLLERGWDVNGNSVGFGTPPLGYAAANNAVDCMRVLIEFGADLEYCDVDGFTSLYHAAWGGNPEALQILLDAGADPDPLDPYGNSPLIRAAAKSHEVTRLLVEAGVDVNEQSNAGSTALINAAARDQPESVHLLIQHGADLEMRLQGRAALAWAIRENSLRAAQVLVRAGADITALDEQGNTPLRLVRDDRALAVLAEARGF
ncbi:ankyrin repeat-containing domain protein [Aspergillus germanicus]